MAKKDIDEIKKLLKTDKLVIGTERTIKQLKLGKLAKVYLAANCAAALEEDVNHYSKIAGVPVVKLTMPNDELGVICKKQYLISVIGIAK